MEDPVGFEPTIRELQSHALPLGYVTMLYYIIYLIQEIMQHKCQIIKLPE